MKDATYMEFLMDSIVGTRDHIKRLCKTKGLSPIVVDQLTDKIELIIELSGKLGRLVQREKDLQELKQMKAELRVYRSGEI